MTTIPYNMTNTTAVLETKTATHSGVSSVATITLSGREARNLAEKQRRDKLNASIQELSTMVPHSAEATRRLDKTAVLRFATHGLRLRHVFGKTARRRKLIKNHQQQPHLTDSILQLLDSFLITVTCSGQIVLISASVEQLLGHCQSDLYGQNILQITHPDDQEIFKQQLIPNDIDALFSTNEMDHTHVPHTLSDDSTDSAGNECRTPSPKEQIQLDDIEKRLREDKRCFTVRLARASTRSEPTKNYEIVKIDGCFRRSDCTRTTGSYPIVSQLIRRSRSNICMNGTGVINSEQFMQHDAIAQAALHGISGNDIVLVGMARVIRKPQLLNRYIESQPLEYKTRHLIDGRIVDCDQRISLVAGYMKDEVRNLSPFSFMHQDDVRWVIVALRQMYDCNSNYGESCYRLLSRNGNFIYLKTKGYMDVDKSTNQVHTFICINTLLSEEEGKRQVQAMKNKFSTIIKAKIPNNSTQDLPASQNPQQLERIVLYLIENLQKRNDASSTVTLTEIPKSPISEVQSPAPLALVPPEPESVKNSITQSVNIVNVTAARTLQKIQEQQQIQQRQLSPSHSASEDISPSSPKATEDLIVNDGHSELQRPSVLQMQPQPQPTLISDTTTCQLSTKLIKKIDAVVDTTKTTATVIKTAASSDATTQLQQKILVLKRLHQDTTSSSSNGCSELPAKRSLGTQVSITTLAKTSHDSTINSSSFSSRNSASSSSPSSSDFSPSASNDIHQVLSESLESLDCSLDSINQNARSMSKKKINCLPTKHIERELDDILLEHHKQKEILVNIKSEYNIYMQQQHPHLQQRHQQLTNIVLSAAPTNASTAVPTPGTVSNLNKMKRSL